MKRIEDIKNKYPENIVKKYFKYGNIFNWCDEYYDIAWKIPIISLVIIELGNMDISINTIDVMLEDNDHFLDYEGSSWNEKINFPSELLTFQSEIQERVTINTYSALQYLNLFHKNNLDNIEKYYFKLSW